MRPSSLLIALALVGCAPTLWYKNGATTQDFNRESYVCEREAYQGAYVTYGYGVATPHPNVGLYNRCMVAHGWYTKD